MKCFSSSESFSQCFISSLRSTSSADERITGKVKSSANGLFLKFYFFFSCALPAGGGCIVSEKRAALRCRRSRRRSSMRYWVYWVDVMCANDVPVQNEASAFLYISQMSLYLMGNIVKRSAFSSRRGSASWSLLLASATIFVVWVCGCGCIYECGVERDGRLPMACVVTILGTSSKQRMPEVVVCVDVCASCEESSRARFPFSVFRVFEKKWDDAPGGETRDEQTTQKMHGGPSGKSFRLYFCIDVVKRTVTKSIENHVSISVVRAEDRVTRPPVFHQSEVSKSTRHFICTSFLFFEIKMRKSTYFLPPSIILFFVFLRLFF